ncbi:MAG: type II toxin-antitoxin system Phd/YefM family antitoxin [Desulfobacteraceae bacterium]|nr:MAG: type II toxin-antitoxin system Phd/YefM family antitoxin [Desulfobacteraceae bacterium]
MLVDTAKMIPITLLQKELTKRIRGVADNGETLYILKNNEMEAVILPPQEYEYLQNLSELFEYFEIDSLVKSRLKNYDPSKNISWEEVKSHALSD